MARTNEVQREAVASGPLLDPETVAAWLGVPVSTLYQWKLRGIGPRVLKIGRHLRYRTADVEAWLESRADGPPDGAT